MNRLEASRKKAKKTVDEKKKEVILCRPRTGVVKTPTRTRQSVSES